MRVAANTPVVMCMYSAHMCVCVCVHMYVTTVGWVKVVTTIRLHKLSGISSSFDLPSTVEGRRKRSRRSRGDAPEMNTLVKPAAV